MEPKQAHRIAIAHNRSDYPLLSRKRALSSFNGAGIEVVSSLRLLYKAYSNTSHPIVIKLLPQSYNDLHKLLDTLRGMRSSPVFKIKPRTRLNMETGEREPIVPVWCQYTTPQLIKPTTIRHTYMRDAQEQTNLSQVSLAMCQLAKAADMCLDFNPSLIPSLHTIHTALGSMLNGVYPTWIPPLFTTKPIDPTATPMPAYKYFDLEPYSTPWRKRQREQYHKQRGNKPNQTSAKRKTQP